MPAAIVQESALLITAVSEPLLQQPQKYAGLATRGMNRSSMAMGIGACVNAVRVLTATQSS